MTYLHYSSLACLLIYYSPFINEPTCTILFDTGLYPMQDVLHKAIKAFGIQEEIQARDIIEIVNSSLKKLPTLESLSEVQTLLYENFIVSPNIDFSYKHNSLQDIFENMLVLSAIINDLKSQDQNKQLTLTRGLTESPIKLSIQAKIADFDGTLPIQLPYMANSSCSLLQNWDDLYESIDPVELWMSAPFGQSQIQALKVSAILAMRPKTYNCIILRKWYFGKHFLETAKNLGFLHTPIKARGILRACVETIMQTSQSSTHALRTGQGGNNPPKMRGDDKAWRRDIDHEFHLHYWETSEGIEFASVVVHNDFSIPK